MMGAQEVLEVLDCLSAAGINTWLDGGWGVDALLGGQTRPHDDLDLVLTLDQTDATQAALAPLGYRLLTDERPTRLVLRADPDRRIDLHTVHFDRAGNGVQRQPDGHDFRYPAAGFTGQGRISGQPVPCLTAEIQMLCHTGYPPDATDRLDMQRLHDRCGVPLPSEVGCE